MPCVVGPYTGINAKLTLLENTFRNTALGGKSYQQDTQQDDDRFTAYKIPINAIAVSSGQNDGGLFELNFKDERYLPFEGAGVISKWRLELPAIRQFDYQTIADVVLHLKYTASEGGDRLKLAALKALNDQLENLSQAMNQTGLHAVYSMQHDLPNEWNLLNQSGAVDVTITTARLPYMVQAMGKAAIEEVMFLALVQGNPASYPLTIDGAALALNKISNDLQLAVNTYSDFTLDKDNNLKFNLAMDIANLKNLNGLYIAVKYAAPKYRQN